MTKGRLHGKKLFLDPSNLAVMRYTAQATAWRKDHPGDAACMDVMAKVPHATWSSSWGDGADWTAKVDGMLTRAAGGLQVLILYYMYMRDLGSLSAGGAKTPEEYEAFVRAICAGVKGRGDDLVVVLEPDAVPMMSDMDDDEDYDTRVRLLTYAIRQLIAVGCRVYVDAGDSNWVHPSTIAYRLRLLGVGSCPCIGFALNFAHNEFTDEEHVFAQSIRGELGPNVHYVIDTGRNGQGPYVRTSSESSRAVWCNAKDRGCGEKSSVSMDIKEWSGFDMRIWGKAAISSDGAWPTKEDRDPRFPDGAPPAGSPNPRYALECYKKAKPALPRLWDR